MWKKRSRLYEMPINWVPHKSKVHSGITESRDTEVPFCLFPFFSNIIYCQIGFNTQCSSQQIPSTMPITLSVSFSTSLSKLTSFSQNHFVHNAEPWLRKLWAHTLILCAGLVSLSYIYSWSRKITLRNTTLEVQSQTYLILGKMVECEQQRSHG